MLYLRSYYALAILSSLIAAIHPGFILYAGMLATESLFTIFLCLFFIFFLLGISKTDFSNTLFFTLAGLMLGIASLIRPIGHYIICITLVTMLIAFHLSRQTIKQSLILFFSWLCVILPWLMRNYLIAGALFFHTLPGLHFLQYTAANIVVAHEGCSYLAARTTLLKKWEAAIAQQEKVARRTLGDYQRCTRAEHMVFTVITQHPFLALKDFCTQIIKTSCSLYSAQVLLADTGKWPEYTGSTSFSTKIKRFLYPKFIHRWLFIHILLYLLT